MRSALLKNIDLLSDLDDEWGQTLEMDVYSFAVSNH